MKSECLKALEIAQMLTLSTAHIKEETADFLDNEDYALVVYPKSEYGWFILADLDSLSEEELSLIPNDLMAVIQFAKENGCSWLCLDRDGSEIEQLPVYDWQ